MFNPTLDILFATITGLLVTSIAIPKVIFFAEKLRLFAPKADQAVHEGKVPSLGGIAIFFGIISSLLFWSELINIQFILTSLLIVFFVGIIDDLLSLSPTKKLIGQIIAILAIIVFHDLRIDNFHGVLGIYDLSYIMSVLFTVFVVIVVTNGYNLIDGVDGLAGSIGIIASLSFGIIAFLMNQLDMAMIAFTLSGVLFGFLVYNFHPAKIFMGDTGSLVVGMILSILAINLVKHGFVYKEIYFPQKGPLLSIAFLAIPLFDSLRVFINRIRKGKHPLSPAVDHIHHALLRLRFGHLFVSLILCIFSIAVIILTYFLIKININIAIALLALFCYIIILWPFYIISKKS